MASKIILSICVVALSVQAISCTCAGRWAGSPYGYEAGALAADRYAADRYAADIVATERYAADRIATDAYASNWYNGLGYGAAYEYPAAYEYGAFGQMSPAASRGGPLPVASSSPISPNGVSLLSENAIEGVLGVAGRLPFLGTVALEGALPTAGAGSVAYGSGNGNVGILAEGAPEFGYGYGGYNAAELGYGYGAMGRGYGYGC
ncbi:chorion class B protein M2410-like [Leptidea sinapis]|uniref:chorion class B protein M2410-like n=1 Tax=Leptidea sinapis TaxID=189913 RepID=UPI0021C35E1D|nr:chorion class B protein M2410-like [Leptidea sinapis]